jgi:hypothetical protein
LQQVLGADENVQLDQVGVAVHHFLSWVMSSSVTPAGARVIFSARRSTAASFSSNKPELGQSSRSSAASCAAVSPALRANGAFSPCA